PTTWQHPPPPPPPPPLSVPASRTGDADTCQRIDMTRVGGPVRLTTWGPKTLYFPSSSSSSSSTEEAGKEASKNAGKDHGSTKHKHNVVDGKRKAKKQKAKKQDEVEIKKYLRVILNGTEHLACSETTETLAEDVKRRRRTWVVESRSIIVAVEKEVDEEDIDMERLDSGNKERRTG
ncbi:MAG: hypothetical protein Q9190_002991, partial [Brigantiaea leucoxantha]